MPFAPKTLPPVTKRPDRKESSAARGYGYAHQQARGAKLRAEPLCERCRAAFSEHLHHRDRDPANRAPDNLEALCRACHAAEHAPR